MAQETQKIKDIISKLKDESISDNAKIQHYESLSNKFNGVEDETDADIRTVLIKQMKCDLQSDCEKLHLSVLSLWDAVLKPMLKDIVTVNGLKEEYVKFFFGENVDSGTDKKFTKDEVNDVLCLYLHVIIHRNQFNGNLILRAFSDSVKDGIIKEALKICEVIPKEILVVFIANGLTPQIFNLNVKNDVRRPLLDLALGLIPMAPLTLMSPENIATYKNEVCTKYLKTAHELFPRVPTSDPASSSNQDGVDPDWPRVCAFLLRFFGTCLHDDIVLINTLLGLVTSAFKSKCSEYIAEAYDCWRELVDNYRLNWNYLTLQRQINLLVKPLNTKLSRCELVLWKRFNLWLHLIRALTRRGYYCVKDFLTFCFSPFHGQLTVVEGTGKKSGNVTNPAKVCKSLWPKMTDALIAILGHYGHPTDGEQCLSADDTKILEVVLVNDKNIFKLHDVLIPAVTECCLLLQQWCPLERRPKIVKCLWTSILHLTAMIDKDELKEQVFKFTADQLCYVVEECKKNMDFFDHFLLYVFEVIGDNVESKFLQSAVVRPVFLKLVQSELQLSEKQKQAAVKIAYYRSSENSDEVAFFRATWESFFKKNVSSSNELALMLWTHILENLGKVHDKQRIEATNAPSDKNESNVSEICSFLMWPLRFKLEKCPNKEFYIEKWKKTAANMMQLSRDVRSCMFKELKKFIINSPENSANVTYLVCAVNEVLHKDKTEGDEEFVYDVLKVVGTMVNLPVISTQTVDLEPIFDKCVACLNRNSIADKLGSLDIFSECLEGFIKHKKVYSVVGTMEKLLVKVPENIRPKLVSAPLNDVLIQLSTNSDRTISESAIKIITQLEERSSKTTPQQSLSRGARIANMVQNRINTTSPKPSAMIKLFGQDTEGSPSIKLKGSMLSSNSPTGSPSTRKIISDGTPKRQKSSFNINDDSDSKYVLIDTKVKFDPKKLTERQKEITGRRRDDIPALYQDLSQSQSNMLETEGNQKDDSQSLGKLENEANSSGKVTPSATSKEGETEDCSAANKQKCLFGEDAAKSKREGDQTPKGKEKINGGDFISPGPSNRRSDRWEKIRSALQNSPIESDKSHVNGVKPKEFKKIEGGSPNTTPKNQNAEPTNTGFEQNGSSAVKSPLAKNNKAPAMRSAIEDAAEPCIDEFITSLKRRKNVINNIRCGIQRNEISFPDDVGRTMAEHYMSIEENRLNQKDNKTDCQNKVPSPTESADKNDEDGENPADCVTESSSTAKGTVDENSEPVNPTPLDDSVFKSILESDDANYTIADTSADDMSVLKTEDIEENVAHLSDSIGAQTITTHESSFSCSNQDVDDQMAPDPIMERQVNEESGAAKIDTSEDIVPATHEANEDADERKEEIQEDRGKRRSNISQVEKELKRLAMNVVGGEEIMKSIKIRHTRQSLGRSLRMRSSNKKDEKAAPQPLKGKQEAASEPEAVNVVQVTTVRRRGRRPRNASPTTNIKPDNQETHINDRTLSREVTSASSTSHAQIVEDGLNNAGSVPPPSTPPKRRGRPKKIAQDAANQDVEASTSNTSITDTSINSDVSESPLSTSAVPKKRRRRRRSKSSPTSKSIQKGTNAPNQNQDTSLNSVDESPLSAPLTPSKKRGRPSKASLLLKKAANSQENKEASTSLTDTSLNNDNESTPASNNESLTLPKRRRRGKKASSASEAPSAQEVVSNMNKDPVASEPATPSSPTKRRGRRSKDAAPVIVEQVAPEKKRRSRKRKLSENVGSNEENDATDTNQRKRIKLSLKIIGYDSDKPRKRSLSTDSYLEIKRAKEISEQEKTGNGVKKHTYRSRRLSAYEDSRSVAQSNKNNNENVLNSNVKRAEQSVNSGEKPTKVSRRSRQNKEETAKENSEAAVHTDGAVEKAQRRLFGVAKVAQGSKRRKRSTENSDDPVVESDLKHSESQSPNDPPAETSSQSSEIGSSGDAAGENDVIPDSQHVSDENDDIIESSQDTTANVTKRKSKSMLVKSKTPKLDADVPLNKRQQLDLEINRMIKQIAEKEVEKGPKADILISDSGTFVRCENIEGKLQIPCASASIPEDSGTNDDVVQTPEVLPDTNDGNVQKEKTEKDPECCGADPTTTSEDPLEEEKTVAADNIDDLDTESVLHSEENSSAVENDMDIANNQDKLSLFELETRSILSEELALSSSLNPLIHDSPQDEVEMTPNHAQVKQVSSPKTISPSLPTSPITGDTPSRTSELVTNTVDISPIKSSTDKAPNIIPINLFANDSDQEDETTEKENATSITSSAILESNWTPNIRESDFECTAKTLEESKSRKSSVAEPLSKSKPSSRSAKLLNLIPNAPSIAESKSFPQIKSKVNAHAAGTVSSPQTDRIRRMMMNFAPEEQPSCSSSSNLQMEIEEDLTPCEDNNIEVDTSEEKEPVNEEDILTFTRILPKASDTPKISILKRKAPETLEEGLSPCAKRKRVNFCDPPTSCKKVFYADPDEHTPIKIIKKKGKIAALVLAEDNYSLVPASVQHINNRVAKDSDPVVDIPDEQVVDVPESAEAGGVESTAGAIDVPVISELVEPTVAPKVEALSSETIKEKQDDSTTKPIIISRPKPVVPQTSVVSSKDKQIFPILIGCTNNLWPMIRQIARSDFDEVELLRQLKADNIATIGDLAALKECDLVKYNFKIPKAFHVRNSLKKFKARMEATNPNFMKDLEAKRSAASNAEADESGSLQSDNQKKDVPSEGKADTPLLITTENKSPIKEGGPLITNDSNIKFLPLPTKTSPKINILSIVSIPPSVTTSIKPREDHVTVEGSACDTINILKPVESDPRKTLTDLIANHGDLPVEEFAEILGEELLKETFFMLAERQIRDKFDDEDKERLINLIKKY